MKTQPTINKSMKKNKAGSTAFTESRIPEEAIKPFQGDDKQTDEIQFESVKSENGSKRKTLEGKVRNTHKKLTKFGTKTLPIAIDLGKLLSELKKEVRHGEWATYSTATLGISPRCASDYMLLAKHGDELKSATRADFGIVEAIHYIREKKKGEPKEKHYIDLADGRKIPWRDGPIDRSSVELAIDAIDTDPIRKCTRKEVAKKQEKLVRVVTSANGIFKGTNASVVSEMHHAFATVDGLLSVTEQLEAGSIQSDERKGAKIDE